MYDCRLTGRIGLQILASWDKIGSAHAQARCDAELKPSVKWNTHPSASSFSPTA